jgi:hypothetical protein
VQFKAVDQHFFGNTGILATNNPERGHGRGVQAEAVLSYYLSPQLSQGVGARYWAYGRRPARSSATSTHAGF